jgi:pimeloyl-ACP methyl ester carboxylesterase
MSAIKIGDDLIHYEVLGRGRPVILVHGWLGCWRYWIPAMQTLHLKYRVYALDLYGFGDSSKSPENPSKYKLDEQVKLLDGFMKELAISKAALVGHGLGALVVAKYARLHPDKVARVLSVSAPLYDTGDLETRPQPGRLIPLTANSSQSAKAAEPFPSEATIPSSNPAMRRLFEEAAKARANGELPPRLPELELSPDPLPAIPSPSPAKSENKLNYLRQNLGDTSLKNLLARCFKPSEPEYGKLQVDVEKTDPAVLKLTVESYDAGEIIDAYKFITLYRDPEDVNRRIAMMLIHGADDNFITQPPETVLDYLTREGATVAFELNGVRHFPMLEDDRFNRLLNDFLEVPDITKIENKERWKRRTR